MSKFRNKYRNESARAQWWNYNSDAAYFITICTSERACILGEISDNQMHQSKIGEIVNQEWNLSFDLRKELFCDVFIIMPNHIHAILRIENKIDESGVHGLVPLGRTAVRPNGIQTNTGIAYRSPKSISSFVAGFKSSATKRINEFRKTPKKPVWQPRFHDRIIRNEKEYNRIYNYIENNVAKWDQNKFYEKGDLTTN
jgi:REP element-mobilizing transposase RayT